MKIKYRIKQFGFGIESVNVVRETEKCFWIERTDYRTGNTITGTERRELKSERFKLFDNFISAKVELIARCKADIQRSKANLVRLNTLLSDAENMEDEAA